MLLAVLLFNLVVTIFAYGFFPFVFARVRKKSISGKKYKRICYGFNAIPMIWFFLLNRRTTLMPYLLWTSVFVYFGTNKLGWRGVLSETDTKEKIDTELTAHSHIDGDSQYHNKSLEAPQDYVGKYQKSNASELIINKANPKQKYCKHCGGAIDNETKKCSKCGKQYFRPQIRWGTVFAFIVICLAIGITLISLQRIGQYQDQIVQLNNRITDLEATISTKDIRISNLEDQISDKNDRNRKMIREKQNLESKIAFYDENVVFVRANDLGTYHKYDCLMFKYNDTLFWAYTPKTANERGFDPCWYCCK